jgi:hypothetical protein
MQNKEELRQKGTMGVKKQHVARVGKNIIFRGGGGINIVFGPKYRPLGIYVTIYLYSGSLMVPGGGARFL